MEPTNAYFPWVSVCPTRPDQPKQGLTQEEALANSCQRKDGYFVAPNLTYGSKSKGEFSKKEPLEQKDNLVFLTRTEELETKKREELETIRQAGGKMPPLANCRVAVKDNILVKGIKTTCASKMLAEFVSPFSATVWERLEEAGALLVGKTNLDEFAMGSEGKHSAFGRVLHPKNPNFLAGGSSSGSAAAVALGECDLALGSDTGGSVRLPAAFCGIYGFKPTFGSLSRYGMVAYASDLEQIGLFSKDLDLMALALQVMAGEDGKDATLVKNPFGETKEVVAPRKPPKFGICLAYQQACSKEMRQAIERLETKMESAGVGLIPVTLPEVEYQQSLYGRLAYAAAFTNLARYQGIRFGGDGSPFPNPSEVRLRNLGEEVLRRLSLGKESLQQENFETLRKEALLQLRSQFETALEECDALLLPSSSTSAFLVKESEKQRKEVKQADQFLVGANLSGLPSLSLPAGEIPCGWQGESVQMPFGVQLVGRPFSDLALLGLAKWMKEIIE